MHLLLRLRFQTRQRVNRSTNADERRRVMPDPPPLEVLGHGWARVTDCVSLFCYNLT